MRADRRQIALWLSCAVVGFHPTMAATPKAAPLTAAELAMVDRAGVYLQALREVRGRFVQTDARGGVAKGDLYLKRPGRARFWRRPTTSVVVRSVSPRWGSRCSTRPR